VAIQQTADPDVFSTPVMVNSCAVENWGRDGEGLVSFARGLVRVIGRMVRVIGGAPIPIVALVGVHFLPDFPTPRVADST
jgi:hypothetical protein